MGSIVQGLMQKIWHKAIGVDFGSENLRVWWSDRKEGVTIPSYVALDERTNLLAIGEDARALSERNAQGMRVIHPVERGVIQDEYTAKLLLRAVMGQVGFFNWLVAPNMMMSVPAGATAVQRSRAEDLLRSVGARVAYTIPQSLAAAIGGGVPAQDSSGSVVVQLGGGIVEAAAISLGGIVATASNEFGGRSLIDQLRRIARERYGAEISYETLHKILPKIQLGSPKESELEILGKDSSTGEPRKIFLQSRVYEPILLEHLEQIVITLKKLLSQVPPAITTDIVDRGMLLAGGLAQLNGLPLFLSQRLEVPCAVMEDPENAVIKGIAYSLENLDEYANIYD